MRKTAFNWFMKANVFTWVKEKERKKKTRARCLFLLARNQDNPWWHDGVLAAALCNSCNSWWTRTEPGVLVTHGYLSSHLGHHHHYHHRHPRHCDCLTLGLSRVHHRSRHCQCVRSTSPWFSDFLDTFVIMLLSALLNGHYLRSYEPSHWSRVNIILMHVVIRASGD